MLFPDHIVTQPCTAKDQHELSESIATILTQVDQLAGLEIVGIHLQTALDMLAKIEVPTRPDPIPALATHHE